MEEAFQSLAESLAHASPDDLVDLREELVVQFDRYYRSSTHKFSIQGVLSDFSDSIWRFAKEIAKRDGRYTRESIRSAFEAFCVSGELILNRSPKENGGEVGIRDLLSMASGPQVKYYVINAKPIGENLNYAASVLLDDGSGIREFTDKLENALSGAGDGDEKSVADMSELIFGDEIVAHMGGLSDAFEDYYFGTFVDRIGAIATKARLAYEDGRIEDSGRAIEELERAYLGIKKVFDSMRDVSLAVSRTIKFLERMIEDEGARNLINKHKPFMRHFASVGHDYNNFLSAINGYLKNISVKVDKRPVLIKELEELCLRMACSTLRDLLAVVKIKMSVVRIGAENIDRVSIPARYRRALFRSLFELVRNAEKYRDRDKDVSHTIDLLASLRDGTLRFTVEDNGVGIGDIAKALMEGVRERPDLAEGSGIGLAGIVRMAEENGWRFSLESELGVGTKGTLEVDTSGWDISIISSILERTDAPELKGLVEHTQAVLSNYETLASSWIGYEGALEHVRLLRDLSDKVSVDDVGGIAGFLKVLLSDECRIHFAQLIERYEDKLFIDMMDEIDSFILRAADAIRRDEYESLSKASHEFESGMDRRYFKLFSHIRNMTLGLDSLVDVLVSLAKGDTKTDMLSSMKSFMLKQRIWTHDFGTIVQIFMGEEVLMVRKANKGDGMDKDAAIARLKSLKKWDFSSIPSMIDLIANLVGKGSDMVNVGEGVMGLPSYEIRETARRHLFRIIFELVRNADKYRDKQKGKQFTKIDAMADGSILRIEVEDNGVGIADVAKVLEIGVRERSDLARGSGFGLAGIVRMSEDNGWRFSLESELGVGTKATLEIDTSDFGGGPGGGVGSGAGDGQMPGALASGAMSTMNAVLGAGVLLGFMPSLA